MGDEGGFFVFHRTPWGVTAERTSRPFESARDVHAGFDEIAAGSRPEFPGDCGLMVDLRAVRGRNEEAFEEVIIPRIEAVFGRYAATAIVVRSEMGRLQVRRHVADVAKPVGVFLDLDEALAFLEEHRRPG